MMKGYETDKGVKSRYELKVGDQWETTLDEHKRVTIASVSRLGTEFTFEDANGGIQVWKIGVLKYPLITSLITFDHERYAYKYVGDIPNEQTWGEYFVSTNKWTKWESFRPISSMIARHPLCKYCVRHQKLIQYCVNPVEKERTESCDNIVELTRIASKRSKIVELDLHWDIKKGKCLLKDFPKLHDYEVFEYFGKEYRLVAWKYDESKDITTTGPKAFYNQFTSYFIDQRDNFAEVTLEAAETFNTQNPVFATKAVFMRIDK